MTSNRFPSASPTNSTAGGSNHPPVRAEEWERVTPVYENVPGWQRDTTKATRFTDLPQNAIAYLNRIGHLAGIPVNIIGIGPDRAQTLVRD